MSLKESRDENGTLDECIGQRIAYLIYLRDKKGKVNQADTLLRHVRRQLQQVTSNDTF